MAKQNKALRDPEWPEFLPNCPGCGYSLMGLMPPLNCPECGFEVDGKTLVLHGVVKTDKSVSPMRRVLWALTVIGWIIWTVLFEALIQMLQFNPGNVLPFGTFMLVYLVICIAAVIALVRSSKRDRAGRPAIIFTTGGFMVVASLSEIQLEGSMVTWDRVTGLRLDRVSRVWYRLQIWSSTEKLLNAGVRCPDEHAKLVYDTLEAFRTGRPVDEMAPETHETPEEDDGDIWSAVEQYHDDR